MAATSKRERQIARERYLRQQARRAMKEAQSRHRRQVIAAVLAAAAVIAAAVGLSRVLDLGGEPTAGTTPAAVQTPDGQASAEPALPAPTPAETTAVAAPSPDAQGNISCTFTKTGDATKDVGVPAAAAKVAKPYVATLKTTQGTVAFQALTEAAPCTTRSFAYLAEKGYFTSTNCHRLVTQGISVLQCGDPTSDPAKAGGGGPGYQFANENAGTYPAGTVAMANAGPGTNGSQFFLVYEDSPLPADYSVFGRITSGLEVLKKVAAAGVDPASGQTSDGPPKLPVRLESVTVTTP